MTTNTEELREIADNKVNNMIDAIGSLGELSDTDKRRIRRYVKDTVNMIRESEKRIMHDFLARI